MATDSTLAVRRAILTTLKADVGVTALVAASSIHPQSPREAPAWPFIKYGSPSGTPITASCVDGSEITVALHGFAKPRSLAGQIVETAEDHAARIGAAIARALDKRCLALGFGTARVRWRSSQLLQDGAEADAYHHISNFRVRVIS